MTGLVQTQTVSAGKEQLGIGPSCQWVLLDPQKWLVIGLCDGLKEVTRDVSQMKNCWIVGGFKVRGVLEVEFDGKAKEWRRL